MKHTPILVVLMLGLVFLFGTPTSLHAQGGPGWLPPLEPITRDNVGQLTLLETWSSDRVRGITWLDFHPDGQILAFDRSAHVIFFLDLATGEAERVINVDQDTLGFQFFSSDGSKMVFLDGLDIVIWDVESRSEIRRLVDAVALPVAMSPTENLLAVGFPDDSVGLLDLETGELRYRFPDLSNIERTAATFSPDGTLFAYGSNEYVRVWDVATGEEVMTLLGVRGDDRNGIDRAIAKIIFAPDGETIYNNYFGIHGEVLVTSLAGDMPQGLFPGSLRALSPDGSLIVSYQYTDRFQVMDALTGERLVEIPTDSPPRRAVFNPDGTLLVTNWTDGVLHFWGVPQE